MQGFKVSVADIVERPGCFKDVSVDERLPETGNTLVRVTEDPLRGRLRAEAVVEGILITGSVRGTVAAECARCVTALTDEIELDVCEMFVGADAEVPDEEEVYELEGTELDLEPMLRDAVTLALPLNPVCRPDCKGLCAGCGRDLNVTGCVCVEDDLDPRWAALSELRDKLG